MLNNSTGWSPLHSVLSISVTLVTMHGLNSLFQTLPPHLHLWEHSRAYSAFLWQGGCSRPSPTAHQLIGLQHLRIPARRRPRAFKILKRATIVSKKTQVRKYANSRYTSSENSTRGDLFLASQNTEVQSQKSVVLYAQRQRSQLANLSISSDQSLLIVNSAYLPVFHDLTGLQ